MPEDVPQSCLVEGGGFAFDVLVVQYLSTQAVEEHHDAEVPAEVGGIHDEVGGPYFLGGVCRRSDLPDMALDGFGAALVTDGQLCERLLAVDVLLQQLAGRREFGDGQVLLAGGTFISLPAVFTTVFD